MVANDWNQHMFGTHIRRFWKETKQIFSVHMAPSSFSCYNPLNDDADIVISIENFLFSAYKTTYVYPQQVLIWRGLVIATCRIIYNRIEYCQFIITNKNHLIFNLFKHWCCTIYKISFNGHLDEVSFYLCVSVCGYVCVCVHERD